MKTMKSVIAFGRANRLAIAVLAGVAGIAASAGAWSSGSGGADPRAVATPGAPGPLLAAASKVEWCGDDMCNNGESCSDCPDDCGGPCCGNGYCGDQGEDCVSCPQDCGGGPCCGNGSCEAGESCSSCSQDCTCGPPCGDGVCDRDHEGCNNCPQDCGNCCANNECFPNLPSCEAACCGVCERRIGCGGASAHKCFE